MDINRALTAGDKVIFRNMINATRNCLQSKGIRAGDIDDSMWQEAVNCETAYFSQGPLFTFHTHPNGSEEPSEQDKKTNNKYGKQFMIIGLVPQRTAVVYHANDNFSKKIGQFRL